MLNKQEGSKKQLLILATALIIVVAAAAGFSIWNMGKSQPESPVAPLSQADQQAQDKLKMQVDKTTDTKKKVALMYDYGDYYINSKQYDKALNNALEIEKLEPTDASAGLIAHIYEEKKDYKNAVKYYELAMQRTEKPTSTSANSTYNDYRILKEAAEAKL
jgi:tetratricopeptide (TPR) repeat protein